MAPAAGGAAGVAAQAAQAAQHAATMGAPFTLGASSLGAKAQPLVAAGGAPAQAPPTLNNALSSTPSKPPQVLSPFYVATRDLTCGYVAGAVNVMFGHPFDTVKVVQQNDPAQARQGMLRVARRIFSREGMQGLYRGVSAPMVGYGGDTAINYAVYEAGMARSREWRQQSATHNTAGILASSYLSAAVLCLWITPLELAKTQMQVLPNAKGNVRETFGWLAQCVRERGVTGAYRGLGATLLREVPGNGFYFLTYESGREYLKRKTAEWGWSDLASETISATIPGGTAGLVFWGLVLPMDVIKTKQQAVQVGPGAQPPRLGVVVRQLWREGGARAFFAGWAPLLARAFPANALQFLGFEASRIAARKMFESDQ